MVDVASTPIARLFWEYASSRLVDLPDEVVFARVMERGTLEDSRWLLRSIPAPRLSAWFDARAARHLGPRSLALWACLLRRPTPMSMHAALPWHHAG